MAKVSNVQNALVNVSAEEFKEALIRSMKTRNATYQAGTLYDHMDGLRIAYPSYQVIIDALAEIASSEDHHHNDGDVCETCRWEGIRIAYEAMTYL